MLKLFVDDVRAVPDGSWELCTTITKAIRMLHTQNVEVISLDHDISHDADGKRNPDFNAMHVKCPETYQAIAYYIAAMAPERQPKCTIHSANPGGADKIYRILLEGGIKAKITAIPHPWGRYVGPEIGDNDDES